MGVDKLMGDEIFILTPSGDQTGPIKASVQRNKIYIGDESVVIEEGWKILRSLPNGRSECHTVLQVDFHKDPRGGRLSHFEVTTRKESSLMPTPSSTTINISNSHGIQIGDGNIQNIVESLDALAKAIDASPAAPEQKAGAKEKLKAFLSHPLTVAILGPAAGRLLSLPSMR
jgi:hypothetical protein